MRALLETLKQIDEVTKRNGFLEPGMITASHAWRDPRRRPGARTAPTRLSSGLVTQPFPLTL